MNAFDVIKTICLTEKGTIQADKYNRYSVVADPRANKVQIRQAVEELFKVSVVQVNTINVRGKARRASGGSRPRRTAYRPRPARSARR